MKKKKSSLITPEELEAMGQDSDTKAAKWVIEKGKEDQKEQAQEKAIVNQILEDARKKRFTYNKALLDYVRKQMFDFGCPKGFRWGAYLTHATKSQDGLVLWFTSPREQSAQVAMKITGEPKYDINWIDRRVNDTLDLMDKIEDNFRTPRTKGGILLPN